MKICYLDAFSGISGDMTVGALLDAGAPAEALLDALSSLDTGARFEVEKTARGGVTASKFRVHLGYRARQAPPPFAHPGDDRPRPPHGARPGRRVRRLPAAGRSRSRRARRAHRKSSLPRSRRRRFHRRYRGRLRRARSAGRLGSPFVGDQRRQRHGPNRTRLAPRARPRHRGAAGRKTDLLARTRGRTDHAHRRRARRDARLQLRTAARHADLLHRPRRGRPRFQAARQRAARSDRRTHRRARSDAGQRHRSQHRRFEPPGAGLRARETAWTPARWTPRSRPCR